MGGNSDLQMLAANGQLQNQLNDLLAHRSDHERSARQNDHQAML